MMSRNPTTELQIYKGDALGELGHKDQQIALLEKLITHEPNNALLDNDLGYLYADLGTNLEKAERLIRTALNAEGQAPSASTADSLGWVFYKQGKFLEAMRVFNMIFAMPGAKTDNEHAVIYDHAGDVAFRAGNKDKAVEYWTGAVEKAKKVKGADRETRNVIPSATAKINAVKAGKEPKVAPLGQGVKAEPPKK